MSEKQPSSPEARKTSHAELVNYKDGPILEVTEIGTKVSFDGRFNGEQTRDSEAFDTVVTLGTMVALDCVDYDGNRSIYVAGTAYGDSVLRFDVAEGGTRYTITEDEGFNSALAQSPMTIGARHNRLGERKLTKVSALPQTQVIPGSEGEAVQESLASPISVADRILFDYVENKGKS